MGITPREAKITKDPSSEPTWISEPIWKDPTTDSTTYYPGGSSAPLGVCTTAPTVLPPWISHSTVRQKLEESEMRELLEKGLLSVDIKIESLKESMEFLLGQVIELKALLQNNKENTPISCESSSITNEVNNEDKRFKFS